MDNYPKAALRTMANQQDTLDRINRLGLAAVQLDNAQRGLSDEAGEVASNVKSYIEYGKDFDGLNLVEEVGDVFWRCAQLLDAAQQLDPTNAGRYTFANCMVSNIAKLRKRYPDQYSDMQALTRDIAGEREALAHTSGELAS